MSCYLCVLDFEATCWENVVKDSQEIIEFPSVLYRLDPVYEEDVRKLAGAGAGAGDTDNGVANNEDTGSTSVAVEQQCLEQEETYKEPIIRKYIPTLIDEFARYVRPVLNPKLSPFCTKLTGINQQTVDGADIFEKVYSDHHQWLLSLVPPDAQFAFVTVGNWDIQTMLPKEIKNKKLRLYGIYKRFINIKAEFDYFYGQKSGSMVNMLNLLGLPLEGKHHSGIDDTRNTAKILLKMLDDGHTEFQVQTVYRPFS